MTTDIQLNVYSHALKVTVRLVTVTVQLCDSKCLKLLFSSNV
jgi:hypothetical protein